MVSALAIAGLALTGVVVTGTAAHAATASTPYCTSVDSVTGACAATTTVTATVLTPTTDFSGSGFYVCQSGTLNMQIRMTVQSTWDVTLILADGCVMNMLGVQGGPTIRIASGGSLRVHSQTNNTGRLTVNDKFNGTSNQDMPIQVITGGTGLWISGGHVSVHSTSPFLAAIGSSINGIGGAAGKITIDGNASVDATVTNQINTTISDGCAAAIGGGGSTTSTNTPAGPISINTTGQVVTGRCINSGLGGHGSNIGAGGSTTNHGTASIPVVTVGTPVVTPAATATIQMANYLGQLVTAGAISGVAVGSGMTYSVTPQAGRSLTKATGNGVTMINANATTASPRLVRHQITSGTVSQAIAFTTAPSTTLALTASPAATQTRPGNVTLTATLQQSSTGVNAKSVSFYQDSVLLGTAQTNALGVANYVVTSPAPGTHAYQAKWLGDADYAESESNLIAGYLVVRDTQSALALSGLNTSHVYGDGPLALATSGGNGTGDVTLTSSHPAVASLSDTTTAGAGTLTLHQAGVFTITQTKAQDDTFLETTRTTPTTTVVEATPVAVLTRTGGDALTTPVNLTLRVDARGTGATPQGLVQFYLKSTKLGDPVPLVDNLDGTASVSLNGIPLEAMGSQNVSAVFLGDTGKYKTVTKSDTWFLGGLGYCKVGEPA